MKKSLSSKIVKIKKLQKIGNSGSLCVIIPNTWCNEMNFTNLTKVNLEFLPLRKTIIISYNEKDSELVNIPD